MQHIACSCLGSRGCMSRDAIEELLRDETIEQAINNLLAKLPPPRVRSASTKRHRTPRAQPTAYNAPGGPAEVRQRPKTAPSAIDSSLRGSNHVRNVQNLSKRLTQQQPGERDDSIAGQAMTRAECVSISRHYLDKFPWQSKMCLKAMCDVRRHRQRRQRDDCADRMHALHDAMEQKLQRFIDAQLAELNAWRKTELAEWASIVAGIRHQTRRFAHEQEEQRTARQQEHARLGEQRHRSILALVEAWECEDCKVVVQQTLRLEPGESADVRALNQAMTHARWALQSQQRQGELLRRRFQEANYQWLCCIAEDAMLVRAAQGCYREIELRLLAYEQERCSRCQDVIDSQIRSLTEMSDAIDALGARVQGQYKQTMNAEKLVSRSFELAMQQMLETRIQLAVSDADRSELTWSACENANFARRELRQLSTALWGVVDVLTNRRASWLRRLHQFKHEHVDGIVRYVDDLKGLLQAKKQEVHRQYQAVVQDICARRKEALHVTLTASQHRNLQGDNGIAEFNGVLNRIPSSFITVWQQITLGLEVLQQPIHDERLQQERQLIERLEGVQLKLCSHAAMRQIENMQRVAAHKANVERMVSTFAEQKVSQWLAQRIEPMTELLPVYQAMTADVAALIGAGFPQETAFRFVDDAERQYQQTHPAVQAAAMAELEQWSEAALAAHRQWFADTLQAAYRTEVENLQQECADLTQRVLSAGDDWLVKHDLAAAEDIADLNEAIHAVERDLQHYTRDVESELLGTADQATARLRRFWQENKRTSNATDRSVMAEANGKREPFKRLHGLLVEQVSLTTEKLVHRWVMEVVQSMKLNDDSGSGASAAERFKLAFFMFVLARIEVLCDNADSQPTVDLPATLSRIRQDSELIATSSERFATSDMSEMQLCLAVQEARLAFQDAFDRNEHIAGLSWENQLSLKGSKDLCDLLDKSAQIEHTRKAAELHNAGTVDERMLRLLSHLLGPRDDTDSSAGAALPRLLLTWRMCANHMVEVATRESYTEVLQSLLSESAVRVQTTSTDSLANGTAAASWIVQTLTTIPSVPLSRVQAAIALSLCMESDPLMPLNLRSLDSGKFAAGLGSWCHALAEARSGRMQVASSSFLADCAVLRSSLDRYPLTVVPVSVVAVALSNLPAQQSWQGVARALCLWRVIERHVETSVSGEDALPQSGGASSAFSCTPDWSSTDDERQFDVAGYMQVYRQAVRSCIHQVKPGDTLTSFERPLWYAAPFVNLPKLKKALGNVGDPLMEAARDEYQAVTTWLWWYEEARGRAVASSSDQLELADRRQHRLNYVLETIERNSVTRWNAFVSKLHHKRAAMEVSQNMERIRVYDASVDNFLDVVCQNREAIVRQITEASVVVESYQSTAKQTIQSLETNAIRLSDYFWTRCRACMVNCSKITRSAYDKLHQIWSWQLARGDKLAGDFVVRAREVAKKAEAVDPTRLTAIVEEAVSQLRTLAEATNSERQRAARSSFEAVLAQAVSELSASVASLVPTPLEEAVGQTSAEAAATLSEIQATSDQMQRSHAQAETTSSEMMAQDGGTSEKGEQQQADGKAQNTSNRENIERSINQLADENAAKWAEVVEQLHRQLTQAQERLDAAMQHGLEGVESCVSEIEHRQSELEAIARSMTTGSSRGHDNSEQKAVVQQALIQMKSLQREALGPVKRAERAAVEGFHRRFENLSYQLSVKQDSLMGWLTEASRQFVALVEPDVLWGSLSIAFQQKHAGYGFPDDAVLAGVQCVEAHFHAFKRFIDAWIQELQTLFRRQFELQRELADYWNKNIGTGRVASARSTVELAVSEMIDQVVCLADVNQTLQRESDALTGGDSASNERLLDDMVASVRAQTKVLMSEARRHEEALHERRRAAIAHLQTRFETMVGMVQQRQVECENWRVDTLSRLLPNQE